MPEFWELLKYNVPPNNWRIVTKDNLAASVHIMKDKDASLVCKQIFSTGFKTFPINIANLNINSNETGKN